MDYVIPLNGWAAGEREYRWQADNKFFQKFDNTEILDAVVEVEARAVKSGHYIGVDLDIRGHVTVACDRCLEDLQLPVEAHPAFSVKFGEEASSEEEMREGSREILFLSASDAELDLSQATTTSAFRCRCNGSTRKGSATPTRCGFWVMSR